MEFIISQQVVLWGLVIGASVCAFFAGRATNDPEKIIEHTIRELIDKGFLKTQMKNGEIDIVPLNEE